MICDICSTVCDTWKFRYFGKIFCRQCFHDHFEMLQCVKCGKNKYVHYKTKPDPTCKICLIKDKPCIRCKRPIARFGKIVAQGAVCASCSKYFIEERLCTVCKEYSHNVFIRSLSDTQKPMCDRCYRKTLDTCYGCRRKKPDCIKQENGKYLCKKCLQGDRICRQCGHAFPAGRGRICAECSSRNGLYNKVLFASGALSPLLAEHFQYFSEYLDKKRGAAFASHRILYFFPFFQKLDTLHESLGRFPRYHEIINAFSVDYTRQYLTAMHYFETCNAIHIDKEIQDLYANLDMIERYLGAFKKTSYFGTLIQSYYNYLDEKQKCGKITVRTVRLSLTPAVKYLKYCNYCKSDIPSQETLNGYLWCYPGQTNTLSGFIIFLRKHYTYNLKLSKAEKPKLLRPNASKARRKQQFIQLLRDIVQGTIDADNEHILRISIAYLHDIQIPDYARISFCDIKQKSGNFYLRIAGREISLPSEIIKKLKV